MRREIFQLRPGKMASGCSRSSSETNEDEAGKINQDNDYISKATQNVLEPCAHLNKSPKIDILQRFSIGLTLMAVVSVAASMVIALYSSFEGFKGTGNNSTMKHVPSKSMRHTPVSAHVPLYEPVPTGDTLIREEHIYTLMKSPTSNSHGHARGVTINRDSVEVLHSGLYYIYSAIELHLSQADYSLILEKQVCLGLYENLQPLRAPSRPQQSHEHWRTAENSLQALPKLQGVAKEPIYWWYIPTKLRGLNQSVSLRV